LHSSRAYHFLLLDEERRTIKSGAKKPSAQLGVWARHVTCTFAVGPSYEKKLARHEGFESETQKVHNNALLNGYKLQRRGAVLERRAATFVLVYA
jgi:hypothetical protein